MNPDLEHCIKQFDKAREKGVINSHIEIYAVNKLDNKEDILAFYTEYVEFMQDFINYEIDAGKESSATKLVDKGYDLEQVAEFFVHDGLMFTLGHIFNQNILKIWYDTLPHMNSDYFDSMYKSSNIFS